MNLAFEVLVISAAIAIIILILSASVLIGAEIWDIIESRLDQKRYDKSVREELADISKQINDVAVKFEKEKQNDN